MQGQSTERAVGGKGSPLLLLAEGLASASAVGPAMLLGRAGRTREHAHSTLAPSRTHRVAGGEGSGWSGSQEKVPVEGKRGSALPAGRDAVAAHP